ncbi:MAG TPA: ribosome maturation factor RimP [Firmicutes bacterium]|jgi:ribosome maturation factor RimP|nr:ribosome maturation factor RimP [Bacillota bacterium]HBT17299.1 ribosome maturation factor RimP [Bacillota bacterium]
MSQKVKTVLWELAKKIGEELGYEVVEIVLTKEGSSRILRIFIDHPEGIGIKDCEAFSQQLSAILDEKDPISSSYLLEVSSPGIDRPLTKPEHFRRFVGQWVELKLYTPVQGRRKLKGKLGGWSDGENGRVLLEVDGEKLIIPWALISKARLSYID